MHPDSWITDAPSIYVADITALENGALHGAWISLDQSLGDVILQIHDALVEPPSAADGEWLIMTASGLEPLAVGERENLDWLVRVAAGVRRYGQSFAAWAAHLANEQYQERLDDFPFVYLGHWCSFESYVHHWLDRAGVDFDAALPHWLQPYVQFDLSEFATQLATERIVVEDSRDDGGVYVFRAW